MNPAGNQTAQAAPTPGINGGQAMKPSSLTRVARTAFRKTLSTLTAILALGTMIARGGEAGAATSGDPSTGEPDPGGRFGAGLIVGEPIGASLKCFLNRIVAIDGVVGWSFEDNTDLHLHSDVLFHRRDLVNSSNGELAGYIGVGGRVQFRDNADERFGIRIPLGVAYTFRDAPVDVFGEVAPVIDVSPSTEGDFTAGVGARYWF
jgi:hypothetical protein